MKEGKMRTWLVGFAAAIVLALGLAAPAAFAAGEQITPDSTGSITIGNVETGATVTPYKLINVNWDEVGQQPNTPAYTWDDSVVNLVKGIEPTYVGNDNAVTDAYKDADAAFFDKLAKAIATAQPTITPAQPATTTTAAETTLKDLEMGSYLVLVSNSTNYVYQPIVANFVPTFSEQNGWVLENGTVQSIDAKRTPVEITKTVNDKQFVGAKYGDTVNYDLNAPIPTYPANATNKLFNVSDTLSKGLTLDEGSLTAYGVKGDKETVLDASFYTLQKNQAYENTSNGKTGNFSFRYVFNYDKLAEAGYTAVHIDYNATVNTDAVIGTTVNDNEAVLEFNNSPYDENGYKDDHTDTKVYSYGIDVLKVDKANEQTKLAGAEFTLSKNADGSQPFEFVDEGNGVYHVFAVEKDGEGAKTTTTVVTSDEGTLQIKGLNEGTYYLTETKAPAGYNKPANPVTVKIKDADKDGTLDGAVENQGTTPGIVHETITNSKGFELPTTGGMGTIGITAVGVAVMAFAVFMLLRTRKNNR